MQGGDAVLRGDRAQRQVGILHDDHAPVVIEGPIRIWLWPKNAYGLTPRGHVPVTKLLKGDMCPSLTLFVFCGVMDDKIRRDFLPAAT